VLYKNDFLHGDLHAGKEAVKALAGAEVDNRGIVFDDGRLKAAQDGIVGRIILHLFESLNKEKQ